MIYSIRNRNTESLVDTVARPFSGLDDASMQHDMSVYQNRIHTEHSSLCSSAKCSSSAAAVVPVLFWLLICAVNGCKNTPCVRII